MMTAAKSGNHGTGQLDLGDYFILTTLWSNEYPFVRHAF